MRIKDPKFKYARHQKEFFPETNRDLLELVRAYQSPGHLYQVNGALYSLSPSLTFNERGWGRGMPGPLEQELDKSWSQRWFGYEVKK